MMPVSLESLNLSFNKFSGGIPAEWSSMTNLKELKMVACGLDGESLVLVQVNTTNLRCNGAQDRCPR